MAQNNITTNLEAWNKLDRYSQWMYHMYSEYIGKNVLDIGGGIGTAINFYIRKADRVITTELFDNQVDSMNERFKEFPYFKAVKADIMKDDFSEYGQFDTIILINVLEHISDDLQALINMKDLLTENGKIIVCVPAVSKLYCYMDKNVGHYRRYSKGVLRALAGKSGLNVIENKYMNFMGIIPYYLKGKMKQDTGGSYSTSIRGGGKAIFNSSISFGTN